MLAVFVSVNSTGCLYICSLKERYFFHSIAGLFVNLLKFSGEHHDHGMSISKRKREMWTV